MIDLLANDMTAQNTSNKSSILLNRIRSYIKQIPWFSGLLILLLCYKAYRVSTDSHLPKQAWFQKGFQKFEKLIGLVSENKKKTNTKIENTHLSMVEIPSISPAPIGPDIDFSVYEKKVAQLESRSEKKEKELNQVKEEILKLQEAYTQIKTQLAQLIERVAQHSLTPEPKLTIPKESADSLSALLEKEYSVHAVIEGRAWLSTKAGKLITVNVGSHIPLLGKVQAIDAENSLVYCDEGVITSSANDT